MRDSRSPFHFRYFHVACDIMQFPAHAHLEVRVENHDLLGRDEEVDLGGRLVLTLGRLRDTEKEQAHETLGYDRGS